ALTPRCPSVPLFPYTTLFRSVLTDGTDERAIARGVFDAYTRLNLRYSQLAPLTMWDEKNTGSNLPAQIEIYAGDAHPDSYEFLRSEEHTSELQSRFDLVCRLL